MHSSVDTYRPDTGGFHAGTSGNDGGSLGRVAGRSAAATGEGSAEERVAWTEEHAVWTATGHEPPVFLDHHGRRRRWVLAGGTLAGAAATLWLAALLAGAIGFSTLPPAHVWRFDARPRTTVVDWVDRRRDSLASDRREVTLRRTTASVRRVLDRA